MSFKSFTDGDNEGIVFDDVSLQQAVEYWTEERMEKATPIGIELPRPPSMPDIEKTGVKGTVTEADIKVSPFNAGGKLFFSQGGKDYTGSAEFCADKSIILTAAHCVRDKDTGAWSENIVFKRGFKNCSGDQVCAIRAVAVKAKWYSDKDLRWDYAFGISTSESNVDPLPYQINCPFNNATAFGYPIEFKSANVMGRIDGEVILFSSIGLSYMKGNTMGHGCSGGAWVNVNGNIIMGLNSGSFIGDPDNEYGPLFTADFDSLFNYAKSLK